MNILDTIIQKSREDLVDEKRRFPVADTMERAAKSRPARDFAAAFANPQNVRVIAELKKASPSKGIIRQNFDHKSLCLDLQANGAAALSVLTEKNFFLGSLQYLEEVAAMVDIPVLRKDFIFDPYQIARARVLGADAILLIAAALEQSLFQELFDCAGTFGMHVLCEVHNATELDMVMTCNPSVVGINCRDLKTFKTDLDVTRRLLARIPDSVVAIAESGIHSPGDIRSLIDIGADGFLIGESLMREAEPGEKLADLIRGAQK